jgi:biopolymer transport protein ExbB/TolQ
MQFAWELIVKFHSQGEGVMWWISLASIAAWWIGMHRLMDQYAFRKAWKRYLEGQKVNHPILKKWEEDCTRSLSPENQWKMLDAIVQPWCEKGVQTLAVLAQAMPLLGLLGTVIGLVETFEVITRFGIGNPFLTSRGMSIALLTTAWGIGTAVVAMLLHNGLVRSSDKSLNMLDQTRNRLVRFAKENQNV